MPDYTKNIGLEKPWKSDYYNIETFNKNADIIDKAIGKLNLQYEHIQSTISREWIITHSLNNQYPNVKIFDINGNEIFGDITYKTQNMLIINFDVQINGKAIIKN